MPARTGQQYLAGLRAQEREVWLGGERVRDVTTHPGLARGAQAVARLYDMQYDPKLRDVMTYTSPSSGQPVGRSFDIPKTRDALETPSLSAFMMQPSLMTMLRLSAPGARAPRRR